MNFQTVEMSEGRNYTTCYIKAEVSLAVSKTTRDSHLRRTVFCCKPTLCSSGRHCAGDISVAIVGTREAQLHSHVDSLSVYDVQFVL